MASTGGSGVKEKTYPPIPNEKDALGDCWWKFLGQVCEEILGRSRMRNRLHFFRVVKSINPYKSLYFPDEIGLPYVPWIFAAISDIETSISCEVG